MREIKFRAWDSDIDHMYYNPVNAKIVNINDIFSDSGNWSWMQSTGLKDKNGKVEVYEGDIVRFSDGGVYAVEFKNAQFQLADSTLSMPSSIAIHKSLEVIGNIYENPNLIPEYKTEL